MSDVFHLQPPTEAPPLFSLGSYNIVEKIAQGGMGEVFRAYDVKTGREIALKRIRQDKLEHTKIKERFLREAYLTSQLSHPTIIPIYTIEKDFDPPYYTMPFIHGRTLKAALRAARKAGKHEGENSHFVRVFLNVCQGVAYAYSKKVLHRDLKPENVMVGTYGEVLLLDWGLAEVKEDAAPAEKKKKVVGTLSYMAPERAFGREATIQGEIYSLGVILYQLLTWELPYERHSIKDFRKKSASLPPAPFMEAAPYKEIPFQLEEITFRCLAKRPEDRYGTIEDLIEDLETYLEGSSGWLPAAKLSPNEKEDWEFQEHVLFNDPLAITRGPASAEWVHLMVSAASFSENMKVEAQVCLGTKSRGIGFLLGIPEVKERSHVLEGYSVWLSSKYSRENEEGSTKLLRSSVQVLDCPEVTLEENRWQSIRIEKVDETLTVYIDGILQFSYISHLPLVGTHFGLFFRDTHFEMRDLSVFIKGKNLTVSCLAVPDAFLASRDYTRALSEYRRIAHSFPGHKESYRAIFRAGVTLLESGKSSMDRREEFFEAANLEFERLHHTQGAPLEYLGKSLVYREKKEYEEEAKCFELAWRRYPHHPFLPAIQQQVLYRMHESSQTHRRAAYLFVLFSARYLSDLPKSRHTERLFDNVMKHGHPLDFLLPLQEDGEKKDLDFAVRLAFCLGKKWILEEIFLKARELYCEPLAWNALFSLIKLKSIETVKNHLETFSIHFSRENTENLELALLASKDPKEALLQARNKPLSFGMVSHLATEGFLNRHPQAVLDFLVSLPKADYDIRPLIIAACLWLRRFQEAGKLFEDTPLELLGQEDSPYYALYGCYLAALEGKEMAEVHFNGALEAPYPHLPSLLAHAIAHGLLNKKAWHDEAFYFEKEHLFLSLALFYHCLNQIDKENHYHALAKVLE